MEHWIFKMSEGGSVITKSPRGRITECHMPIQTWWTAVMGSSGRLFGTLAKK